MPDKDLEKQEDVDLEVADEQQEQTDEKEAIEGKLGKDSPPSAGPPLKESDPPEPTEIELYTTLDAPRGKRFRLVDRRSGLPDMKQENEIILFPDEPTKVPVEKAKKLMSQDSHLVSTEPYSEDKDPVKVQFKEVMDRKKARADIAADDLEEKRKAADLRFQRKNLSKKAQKIPQASKKNKDKAKIAIKEDYRGKYLETVAALAERNIKELKPVELKQFASSMGLKLTGGMKNVWISQLEARAAEITEGIKLQMKEDNKG